MLSRLFAVYFELLFYNTSENKTRPRRCSRDKQKSYVVTFYIGSWTPKFLWKRRFFLITSNLCAEQQWSFQLIFVQMFGRRTLIMILSCRLVTYWKLILRLVSMTLYISLFSLHLFFKFIYRKNVISGRGYNWFWPSFNAASIWWRLLIKCGYYCKIL